MEPPERASCDIFLAFFLPQSSIFKTEPSAGFLVWSVGCPPSSTYAFRVCNLFMTKLLERILGSSPYTPHDDYKMITRWLKVQLECEFYNNSLLSTMGLRWLWTYNFETSSLYLKSFGEFHEAIVFSNPFTPHHISWLEKLRADSYC